MAVVIHAAVITTGAADLAVPTRANVIADVGADGCDGESTQHQNENHETGE
jgi:hypothetical protein